MTGGDPSLTGRQGDPRGLMLLAGRAVVGIDRFMAMAGALAMRLPDGPAALNLCERRDNFLVAFVALLIRGQACLLPPSRAPAVVAEVMEEHPGSYRLEDELVEGSRDPAPADRLRFPSIPSDRVVVVGYTSGSTVGRNPIRKPGARSARRWRSTRRASARRCGRSELIRCRGSSLRFHPSTCTAWN